MITCSFDLGRTFGRISSGDLKTDGPQNNFIVVQNVYVLEFDGVLGQLTSSDFAQSWTINLFFLSQVGN